MIKLTASVLLLLFVESCFLLFNVVPCDSRGSKNSLSFNNVGNHNNNSHISSLYLRRKREDNLSIVRQQKLTDKKYRNFVEKNVQNNAPLVLDNPTSKSTFGPKIAIAKSRTHMSRSWLASSPRLSKSRTSTTSTTTTTESSNNNTEVYEETNPDEVNESQDYTNNESEDVEVEKNEKVQGVTTTSKTVKTGTKKSISDKSSEKSVKNSELNEYEDIEEGDDKEGEVVSKQSVIKTTTTSIPLATTKKPASAKSSLSSKDVSKIKGGNEKKGRKENKPSSSSSKLVSKQTTEAAPTVNKKRTNETSIPNGNEDNDTTENDDNEENVEESKQEEKQKEKQQQSSSSLSKKKKKPLVFIPFIRPKNETICTPEAYLEFPRDLIGNKWRARGLVIIHIIVVCYMFYSLALVCERYFMPSLEEFAQHLQLSEDVAGATLMSAGSSAPELFTAILGVFIAKGDVGTGAIVGSAVFNILFVIGVCAFVSTTSAQLDWWPVLRDSIFYTFTVLVLILFIYDERVTAFESFSMILLYCVYILLMVHNEKVKDVVTRLLLAHPITAKIVNSAVSIDGSDEVFSSASSATNQKSFFGIDQSNQKNYQTTSMTIRQQSKKTNVEEDSIFMAALLVIVQHKRLFKCQLRFQSAARYIIIKRQHKIQARQQSKKTLSTSVSKTNEVNYFGPESNMIDNNKGQKDRIEAYAANASLSKNKFSIVSKDDYEFWNRPPEEGENYYIWLAKIPVNYVLHYTCPDCALYPDKYLYTFFISIAWTAFFSYIMVWMVTLIGFTLGIPDSIMGFTFLAAGTSIPDCYSSIHAARNGMANMAVSNSIGSNVFDILIGLSLPWFIQTAIYPGVVATINSRGIIYSVILLFLSLIVTIYLMNKYEWTLKPRLGLALLIAYGLFIVLTCMLEFNLFGHVNPPPC